MRCGGVGEGKADVSFGGQVVVEVEGRSRVENELKVGGKVEVQIEEIEGKRAERSMTASGNKCKNTSNEHEQSETSKVTKRADNSSLGWLGGLPKDRRHIRIYFFEVSLDAVLLDIIGKCVSLIM